MPLRDHFRTTSGTKRSWTGLHGQWPAVIIQMLREHLPPGFVAEPRVYLGSTIEIDLSTFAQDDFHDSSFPDDDYGGGTATATATATAVWTPTLSVDAERPDDDEVEVRIYDESAGMTLVAAIEIVSPANKDRPDSRERFADKCAALIKKGVAVSLVDVVTSKHFNLYDATLKRLGHADPTMSVAPPAIYAASCRWGPRGRRNRLEGWSSPLEVGKPLPTLPLWLNETLVIPLDLEVSYERTCHDLWIS